MTTAEFVAAHAAELCYGPAYDPSSAPFPEAVRAPNLLPFPAPRQRRPRFTTSTASRPVAPRWTFSDLTRAACWSLL